MKGQTISAPSTNYLFRGDDNYSRGSIGRKIGRDADDAEIQDAADHVLRKETTRTSRFSSFTTEIKIARKFTSANDNRFVIKIGTKSLQQFQEDGIIKIWDPDNTYESLRNSGAKLAKQAADVRAAMKRNREILIEGQITADIIERAK